MSDIAFNLPVASIVAIREHNEKREHFQKALAFLKGKNKELSEEQKWARLQRKPSKGRTDKSRCKALEITTILNVSRRLRGLPMTYTPRVKCRHCGHVAELPPRLIHNYPDRDVEFRVVEEVEEKLWLELKLDEFIKKLTK